MRVRLSVGRVISGVENIDLSEITPHELAQGERTDLKPSANRPNVLSQARRRHDYGKSLTVVNSIGVAS